MRATGTSGGGDGPRIEKLLCIYGWPRSGTTSIAGEINRSSIYKIWIEKNIFTQRSYATLGELRETADRPGGSLEIARRYNADYLARRDGYRVLGEKTTWTVGRNRTSVLSALHENLARTAGALGVDHEMILCVREPAPWLASWAMCHLLVQTGPDHEFFERVTESTQVRELLSSRISDYTEYLDKVLELSDDPRIRVRCVEKTDARECYFLFDFSDYLREQVPWACESWDWMDFLDARKRALEEIVGRKIEGAREAGKRYGLVSERHRPYTILQEDGSTREI